MRNGTSNRKKLNARNIRYRKKTQKTIKPNNWKESGRHKAHTKTEHAGQTWWQKTFTETVYEGQRITQLLFKRNKVYKTIVLQYTQ